MGTFAVSIAAAAAALVVIAAPALAADGTFDRAWGKDVDQGGGTGFEICVAAASCKAGSSGALGGELNTSIASFSAVATDALGNVYFADQINQRIQKFDSSGNWERAWGKDVIAGNAETGFEVCVVAASCQAGGAGGLGGEFGGPQGIATDAQGDVYVTDFFNQRVQKFNSSGGFLRTWGKNVDQTGGSGFEVCTAALSCQGGVTGTLGGEFGNPSNVATDAQGNVYVGEIANQRVQKFDSSGAFLRAWGKDVDQGPSTGFEICIAASSCQAGTAGGLGGEFDRPWVGADAQGNVYVADQLQHRIQKFDSSGAFLRAWGKDVDQTGGTGFEVCVAAASCQGGTSGGLGGEFFIPLGVATDAQRNVYVADLNHRIQKFDSSGTFLRAWGRNVDQGGGTSFEICAVAASCQSGATGGLGGELSFPTGAATDAQGNLYVGDTANNRIQKFADPTPPPRDGEEGDTSPPDTTITKGPRPRTKKKTASFEFSSTEPGSTLVCKLDDGPSEPCTSPHDVKVKKGRHHFEVRATDAAGNVDPTPATQDWKVKKKKR